MLLSFAIRKGFAQMAVFLDVSTNTPPNATNRRWQNALEKKLIFPWSSFTVFLSHYRSNDAKLGLRKVLQIISNELLVYAWCFAGTVLMMYNVYHVLLMNGRFQRRNETPTEFHVIRKWRMSFRGGGMVMVFD